MFQQIKVATKARDDGQGIEHYTKLWFSGVILAILLVAGG
jgi:hypothetical protein